ncbi:8027_t:CDS:1, partial [Dentiscutata erythropus]
QLTKLSIGEVFVELGVGIIVVFEGDGVFDGNGVVEEVVLEGNSLVVVVNVVFVVLVVVVVSEGKIGFVENVKIVVVGVGCGILVVEVVVVVVGVGIVVVSVG